MFGAGRNVDELGLKLLKKIAFAKKGVSYESIKLEFLEPFGDENTLDVYLMGLKSTGFVEEHESNGGRTYRATKAGKDWAICDYATMEENDGSLPPGDGRAEQR